MFGNISKKLLVLLLLVSLQLSLGSSSALWAEEKMYRMTETQKTELEMILKNYEEIRISYEELQKNYTELQTDYETITKNLESSSKSLKKKNLKNNFIIGGVCFTVGIGIGCIGGAILTSCLSK